MHHILSLVLVSVLPFATGEKCKTNGGQCDPICNAVIASEINDCPGAQYCCVQSKPGKMQPGSGTPDRNRPPAAPEASLQKEHFTESILVCSPAKQKYVSSNTETLTCNAENTSLDLLYKDGFRLIQIVDNGKKAIYYLDKK